jgi:signal transduction histidine kinase
MKKPSPSIGAAFSELRVLWKRDPVQAAAMIGAAVYLVLTFSLMVWILVYTGHWLSSPLPGWVNRPPLISESPANSILALLVLPYVVGSIFLATGVWIWIFHRRQSAGRAFAFFTASMALVCSGLFDALAVHQFPWAWFPAFGIAAGAIVDLALKFPKIDRLLARFPSVHLFGYGLGIILGCLAAFNPSSEPFRWGLYGFTALAILFSITLMALRRFQMVSAVEREQVRLVLWSEIIAFVPLVVWGLTGLFWKEASVFNPLLVAPLVVFPVTTGYAIHRSRFLNADFLLSRGFLYGVLLALVAAGYALLVSGIGIVFIGAVQGLPPVVMGVLIFILALAFSPLKDQLQNMVNKAFFRGQLAVQEKLQAFSAELTTAVEITDILNILRAYIQDSVHPARLHIFLYDPFSDEYTAAEDETKRRTSDLTFSISSPLVQRLRSQPRSLLQEATDIPQGELRQERARMLLLGATVFAPIPGRDHLAGWVALGYRVTGEEYTPREVGFIEQLCVQVAVALERAQVIQNMEMRVREMNVLARVAQGVNVTPTLDDILELIYAQTTQIIPADDFHILLREERSGKLEDIFYVEDNERYSHFENQPLSDQTRLEEQVITQRRSILSDDFTQECQKYDLHTGRVGLYAWAGVPLNAGSETIGAVSAAKRDPSVSYTREQLNLLQAIADQAAGAIVKARLLEETDRRARQLAFLNEVSRQLTATLELGPLLETIASNSVKLLETEVSGVLLVDDQTGELVLRAIKDPASGVPSLNGAGAGAGAVGRRLLPFVGAAGQALNGRCPVIVNGAEVVPDWCDGAAQPGEPEPEKPAPGMHRLLVVPLLVQDTVTGVIEVLDKRDGSEFSRNDQDLLAAFAGQAAMAIQNSKLFTSTDRALAARVEELSVMQRIDRELNTSLDTSRAMRITLEWALRQTNAEAGLVGMIVEGGLQVAASQGYDTKLDQFTDGLIPGERLKIDGVIASGLTQRNTGRGAQSTVLLTGARSQILVPVRRETNTMGVVVLESHRMDAFSEDEVAFLTRLSDHAAIAISNAQLYSAVQAANEAKSEFVSFVSHELKNPMTSIKGYTELLAAGAVGPVNEMQANFLATIKSNVERMANLVSDLADVSRIEAGRLKLDFKATRLKDVVDEVTRSMRKQIEEKNQQLVVTLPDDLPDVWADRNRVLQVILNLVSNGYKYTPKEGQITVCAEAVANKWDPDGAPQVVHFWVRDSGIGISPEDQPKIFQKFFRSEDPKTREAPGTGLGLNITRSLVEMQGGKIWFESEFRKGTTFHFTIPTAVNPL